MVEAITQNCILCKSSPTTPCPRCQKPLCPKHGTAVYNTVTGDPVYLPGLQCRAPLAAAALPFITCFVKGT